MVMSSSSSPSPLTSSSCFKVSNSSVSTSKSTSKKSLLTSDIATSSSSSSSSPSTSFFSSHSKYHPPNNNNNNLFIERINQSWSSLSSSYQQGAFILISLFITTTFSFLFTSVTAAPLSNNHHNNIPSEAAEHMEGLLKHLPSSFQTAMSSSTGFTPAFLQSLLLILACEIGDRTFFVAAILAMKSSRLIVWCGAMSALAAMTLLSAAIGKAFPLLLDKKWTSLAASILFAYFGIQLLRDWWRMRNNDLFDNNENDELAEVEEELKSTPFHNNNNNGSSSSSSSTIAGPSTTTTTDVNGNHNMIMMNNSNNNNNNDDDDDDKKTQTPLVRPRSFTSIPFKIALFSPVFAKAFSMTALAEWGDRSQIATIALAASRDMTGVVVGGVIGHCICTGLAVIGGRLLASSISERAVALMGGIMFIAFAFLTVGGVLN